MIRIRPHLDDPRYLRLFHIGAKHTWTAEEVDWSLPTGLDKRGAVALARLISPIYLGEQSAMLGGARAMLSLAESGESSAQLYMASFIMDEARHLEVITRLYDLLGHDPIRIREMPEMLQYHHRMRLGSTPLHWAMGILVSDIFARTFYGTFARTKGSLLFGKLASNIVVDEGRHQAFAEHYLHDHLPSAESGLRQELYEVKEDLLRIVGRMGRKLRDDAEALGIQSTELFEAFTEEVQERSHHVGLRCGPCPHLGEHFDSIEELPQACSGCFVTRTLGGLGLQEAADEASPEGPNP